jgi:hypothetical protein
MFALPDILGQLARPVVGVDRAALATGLRQLADLRAAVMACESRLLAEFESTGGPAADGAADTAGWLRSATGVSAREAAHRVKIARAVQAQPAVGAALDAGTITPEHAGVIARTLARTPQLAGRTEELVAAGQGVAADLFANHARGVELRAARDAGADAGYAFQRRAVTVHHHEDGTSVIHARLTVDGAAEVMAMVDAIAEELWRADHPNAATSQSGARDADVTQRRADALVEMSRRVTAVGPGSGRRTRARLMVLIDHATLRQDVAAAGMAVLEDGTPIPATTARRLACTAGIYPWVLGGASVPLDHGRRRRFASDAQWDALIMRDGGCVVGDCSRPWQWCDAHHLEDWDEQLGPTNLENLALVCERHHHLVHDHRWTLRRTADGGYECRSPNGHLTLTRPPRDALRHAPPCVGAA